MACVSACQMVKDSVVLGTGDGRGVGEELPSQERRTTLRRLVKMDFGEKQTCEKEGAAGQANLCGPATVVASLKQCAKRNDLQKGCQIHADILKDGLLQRNIYVGSALVNMYAKCGALAKAQEVFDELPVHNVVTWSALISGYTQHDHGEKALFCFERMKRNGIIPNEVTYVCVLKACASKRDLETGQTIHAEIVKEGLLGSNTVIGNALVDMYAKFGDLKSSEEVFDMLVFQDTVTWNALIAGYSQQGHAAKALSCFERMQQEGFAPDAVTYACVLGACGDMGAINKGKEIHTKILNQGLISENIFVGNALIDMYSTCGDHKTAQRVFDEIPIRNVVSWNSLITGYTQQGHPKEALICFEHMKLEGVSPNKVTFLNILKACAGIGATDKGQKVYAEIERRGLLPKEIAIGTVLMDLHVKCGSLAKAQQIFDELPVQDVIAWNVLIAGYAQHGCGEEALKCFEAMQCDGISPNVATFISVLQACGSIGSGHDGEKLHNEISGDDSLRTDIFLATALVDMYSKCGMFAKAKGVLDRLSARTVGCWNALIAGYAQLGASDTVLSSLDSMLNEGIKPDFITSMIALNSCSHSGLIGKGQMLFKTFSTEYGIVPSLEHYTCMIDLFCRAGCYELAVAIIKEMPFSADVAVWHVILGACQEWGIVKFGELAFESVLQMDEMDISAYICMSNIYAAAGMQEHANKVEAMRRMRKATCTTSISGWCNEI